MLKRLWSFMFKQPDQPVPEESTEPKPQARTSILNGNIPSSEKYDLATRLGQFAAVRARPTADDGAAVAMDSACDNDIKGGWSRGQPQLSDELTAWYASQSFIGHQLCALVAQHWLVMKACSQPARDAIRNGFTIVDNSLIDDDQMQALERANKRYGLKRNMLEFLTFGRMFGIRIAIFDIDYGDQAATDAAYAAEFNIDGVKENSYRGIIQVDPYWVIPELNAAAAGNPASKHFYEPTWWQINGRRYHRTHLIIYRHGFLADILKPAYLYGGVPVPQLIMERIYGSERTANEAPLLAVTKRTVVLKTDVAQAMGDWDKFMDRVGVMSKFWNNYGTRVINDDEAHEQHDTSLADLDAVIMTQYQLVAAAAEVPATRLLGTAPKGFNATGEFDESSYHETLESIQEHDLTAFAERHLAIAARSAGMKVQPQIAWNPLDVPTEKELADTNLVKAQTDTAHVANGVIDGVDVRKRLKQDKNSGYAGVIEDDAEPS